MTNLEFFSTQSKNLLNDYNTRAFNENTGTYDFSPRFFHDIKRIVNIFKVSEHDPFSLIGAQHIISKLAGLGKYKGTKTKK